jgi:hypothetical protein
MRAQAPNVGTRFAYPRLFRPSREGGNDGVTTDGFSEVLANGIAALVTSYEDGSLEQGDIAYNQIVEILRGEGDYLDFSSYEAAAVYVGSSA